MPFSVLRRFGAALAVGGLALLAVDCSHPVSDTKAQAKQHFNAQNRPLPAIVNGVPLLDLAKHAFGAAEGYGVSIPVNVQAVVTTQSALTQFSVAGGSTAPEYVVALQGRFSCGTCGTTPATAVPMSTTTTDPSSVRVSTMVLELPLPLTNGTTGIAVGIGTPDMTKLGEVYDLDPYIKLLAGSRFPSARSRGSHLCTHGRKCPKCRMQRSQAGNENFDAT